MNQAMVVMANDYNLGFAMPETAQPAKWQSILTAIGSAIPTVVGTYNATRQPQLPQVPQAPPPSASIARAPQPEEDDAPSKKSDGINTNLGFSLSEGLNIGGTKIPVLYLALAGVGLYLLYREPPRKGR